MQQSFDSVIRAKTGFGLDDIFDGYKYKGKNGEKFIFKNEIHEIQFTIDAVRSALMDKIEEKKVFDFEKQLKKKGLYRLRFNLLNFRTQSLNEYRVHEIEENSPYIIMKDVDGTIRKVHFSLLQDQQTKELIEELKQIEEEFDKLELTYILKSIKRICEQVFDPLNESNRTSDIHPTLLRIKVLILEKMENSTFDLSELSIEELTELKEEIEFSLKLVEPSNKKLLQEFNSASLIIKKQIQNLQTIKTISLLNQDNFLEIFEIEKLKTKLIFDISILNNQEDIFNYNYIRIHELLELKTNISFKKPSHKITNADMFIEKIQILQIKFINTQLKVGAEDLDLLARFDVVQRSNSIAHSILQDYNGITNQERFALYKELVDHRLLLLFKSGINDEYFKELARINVNDFYKFIYGIK
ncbi:hypothetical protein HOJ01_00120 [bacterium]|jgi:hypothetical protein|nr:hypothetical protein [bacterium]MBT6293193.1 hypothetical protein [bacterium]